MKSTENCLTYGLTLRVLPLEVETAAAPAIVAIWALMQGVPDSTSSLEEGGAIRGQTQKRIHINVIMSKLPDQDDEKVGKLRIKLPTFQPSDLIQRRIYRPRDFIRPLVC